MALALRLIYLAELSRSPLGTYLLGDGIGYDAWARRIADGDWMGSEVFYQAPLYPYLLGVLYSVAGASLTLVRIAQALAGAASCVLVAFAGFRFFGRREGWTAGALLAFYPPAIFFDGEIQKASFDLLFASSLLFLLARLRDKPARGVALAAGVIAGLFALNRENALLLLPLVAAWIIFATEAGRKRGRSLAILFVAGALCALLPVALRNRAVGGEALLTTSQLGTNFYIGNHEGADGRYQPLRPGRGSARYEREDATELAETAMGRRLSPAEVSDYWLGRALEFVRDEPAQWMRLMGRKVFLLWNRREIVDTTSIEAAADFSVLLRVLSGLHHFGVLATLAAAGIWLTRHRRRDLVVLDLLLAGWSAAVVAFYVLGRYRYPMVPVLALFAGAGLAGLLAASRTRDVRRAVPALIVALLAGIFVNWPASARDPRAITYASLGNAMAEAGKPGDGARMLTRAVELSPEFGEAHLALAHLRYQSGDLDAAEAGYRRAIGISPSAASWNNLGLIAAKRGRKDEALAMFRRAAEIDPRHVPTLHNLARLAFERRDIGEAMQLYRRLIEIAPTDAEAHHQLANLFGFAGELDPARRHYERAVAIDPSLPDAHFKLAVVLERLGDEEGRTRHLARAIELEPRYAERFLRAGANAEGRGRIDEAARIYQQLLSADPDNAEARAALERVATPPRTATR